MLEQIKLAMRITHDQLDDDIEANIDSALEDLNRCGIDTDIESDLIGKAVELYCKAQYDFMGKGEQFEKKYERLRDALSVCTAYREE